MNRSSSQKTLKVAIPHEWLEELNKTTPIMNRKITFTPQQKSFIDYALDKNYSVVKISKIIGLPKSSVYKYRNEKNQEKAI